MKKIDKNYYIIILFSLILMGITIPVNHLFGSLVDWFPQHIMFPDYFRNLFYETGDFFPDFALALGAGQNIFHFSYYGLFNPIILLSYLFPFIDMTTYLMMINAVLYILTGVLIYKWVKKHFSREVSLSISILALCASPLLFHFHRHFMFVSYMPFLVMALIGVESFFEHKKRLLLIFSVFLIIMTSYYYSIPSIVVITFYGIYQFIHKTKEIKISTFLKKGLSFLYCIVLGILLSSILLLPTFYCIFNGRSTSGSTSLWEHLIPQINLDSILYSNYSMGLAAIAVVALLYNLFHKKKENIFLSISCVILLIFPIFSYILNGFLYIRNKVWIPFFPLFIYMIGILLQDLRDKKVDKKFFSIFPILIGFIFIMGYHTLWFYIDCVTVYFLLLFYFYFPKWEKIYCVGFVIPIVLVYCLNISDKYVSKEMYRNAIHSKDEIQNILKKEKDWIRVAHLDESLYNVNKIYGEGYYTDSIYSSVYNKNYKQFYNRIFHNPLSYRNILITSDNHNLLYQMFMGDKYIYSNHNMLGYQKVADSIFKNNNVLPVAYATTHFIEKSEFSKLSYPFTVETILKNAVVEKKTKNLIDTSVKRVDIDYKIDFSKHLKIEKKNDHYKIVADPNNQLILKLDEMIRNKVLLIDFKIGKEWDCSKGDASISVHHTKNTLTCKQWQYKNNNKRFHYVISEKELEKLQIAFAPGEYDISDIHVYEIEYQNLSNIQENIIPFALDKSKTSGDYIEGKIKLSQDGYFITSIPYDSGFVIIDNGRKIDYEKVNTAFLGFPLDKGHHVIKIEYRAKGAQIGRILSVSSLLFLLITEGYLFYKQNKLKK